MSSTSSSRTTHDYLAPLRRSDAVVVLVGPRHRGMWADLEALQRFVGELPNAVTFRVSGMIGGPEALVEDVAPPLGHTVEVYGPDNTPEGRAVRLNKDDRERDASMLVGAHALWLWVLAFELEQSERIINHPFVLLAQEFEIPVFLFLPESMNFEVLELT